jgi:hypothetical protein
MFAGRYLWWLMIGVAGFWFASIHFDHVASTAVSVSGCERAIGACGDLAAKLSGTVKPLGLSAVAAIMLLISVARIRYLGLSLMWAVAVAVWLAASAPFLMLFDDFWGGWLSYDAIHSLMPASLPFLLAFGLFLCFPVEEYDGRASLPICKFQRAACIAACYCVLTALSVEPDLGAAVAGLTRLPSLQVAIQNLQPMLASILRLGSDGEVLSVAAFLIFAGGLAVSLGWHAKLGAVAPRRRSRQAAVIERPCSR